MRATVPMICMLVGLLSCDQQLFGRFLTENPDNCVAVPSSCGPSQRCDPGLERCVEMTDMADAIPIISSITPRNGMNSVETPLAISGSGFVAGATVTIGGQSCTSVEVMATRITCVAPARPATCAAQDVVVKNPDSRSDTSRNGFTYLTAFNDFVPAVPPTLGIAANSRYILSRDLNRDGKADLVSSNENNNNLSIFLGNGDGTFTELPRISTVGNTGIFGVGAAFLNADMHLDLIASGVTSHSYSVYLGNGDGTFGSLGNVAAGVTQPANLVLADLDADGKQDLVMGSENQAAIGVALGNGDGTFKPVTKLTAGVYPFAVVVGDFDGNMKPDIIATQTSTGNLSVFLGNGDGTFGAMLGGGVNTASPSGLTAQDVDADGKLDLVVGSVNTALLSVLLGNGDGTFRPEITVTTGGKNQQTILLADLNSDGHMDLVSPSVSPSTWNFIPGLGNVRYGAALTTPTASQPTGVAVADYNSDQLPDVAVTSSNGVTIGIYLQKCR